MKKRMDAEIDNVRVYEAHCDSENPLPKNIINELRRLRIFENRM